MNAMNNQSQACEWPVLEGVIWYASEGETLTTVAGTPAGASVGAVIESDDSGPLWSVHLYNLTSEGWTRGVCLRAGQSNTNHEAKAAAFAAMLTIN